MMKLTMKEVQTKMAASWGRRAVVVPYRICGNRYRFAVTDHGEHWMPLDSSWVGGCQVFEPSDGSWPEPRQPTWSDAVLAASHRAMAYFLDQGNSAALRRLPRAGVIADSKNWQRVGDESDTWLIPSSKPGTDYQVNGRCTCPDYIHNRPSDGWCKHRIARALAIRAEEMVKTENGAESDDESPTPDPANGGPQMIDLILAFEADEMSDLTDLHTAGGDLRAWLSSHLGRLGVRPGPGTHPFK